MRDSDGMRVFHGADDRAIAEDEYRIVHSPADAAQAVTENEAYGAQVIKIYSNNTPNRGSLSVDEMRAIVAEAQRLGLRVAAHATAMLASEIILPFCWSAVF